jgi:hypothetical protein
LNDILENGVKYEYTPGQKTPYFDDVYSALEYESDVQSSVHDEYEDSSEKPEQEFSTGYEDYTLEEN